MLSFITSLFLRISSIASTCHLCRFSFFVNYNHFHSDSVFIYRHYKTKPFKYTYFIEATHFCINSRFIHYPSIFTICFVFPLNLFSYLLNMHSISFIFMFLLTYPNFHFYITNEIESCYCTDIFRLMIKICFLHRPYITHYLFTSICRSSIFFILLSIPSMYPKVSTFTSFLLLSNSANLQIQPCKSQ